MIERIPVSSEIVDDCARCNPSACCMGNLVIELTEAEANMMTNTGNRLITVTLPAPYLRKEAPYPIGCEKNKLGLVTAFVDEDREFEELEAGYGRFMLTEPCANLKTDMLGRTICAIYDERPRACEDFEAGSESCHKMQERLNKGI